MWGEFFCAKDVWHGTFLFDETGKGAYHSAILNFWERYCNGRENY